MKASRFFAVAGFLAVFACILFLTFRQSARFAEFSWMPQRWGLWLDEHGEFRHFVGFAAFAAAGFALNLHPLFSRSRYRFLRRFRCSHHRTGRLGAFMVLVYVLELGQINMPGRSFDWLDIVNGWAGVFFAWLGWYALKSNQRRRRRLMHEKRHIPINVSSVRFR